MNQPTTHLGNKELHKRHSVMIEGGLVPRAHVMNQTIIDHYLMHGLITLPQFHGGEHLLGQAAFAGVWPKGVDLSKTGGGRSTRPSYVPMGAMRFGNSLVMVRTRFGEAHVCVVREVICFDRDVSEDDQRMKRLRQSLGLINDLRSGGRREPLQRLQKAIRG